MFSIKYSLGILLIALCISPAGIAGTKKTGYQLVSRHETENITLFAKEDDGLFRDFRLNFKGEQYSRPFWVSTANTTTYAPRLYYEDINHDGKKELLVVLNKGYGTGVLLEDVYVYTYTNGLVEELVENPLVILCRNVKTKLTAEQAEILVGGKTYAVDLTPLHIKPEHLFPKVSLGSITDYEVEANELTVHVSAQISPAGFIGSFIIVYEYRDSMYQAKAIEFQPYRGTPRSASSH